jgi:hypothetical protein
VFNIVALAERVGCRSQRIGGIHSVTPVSAKRRLFAPEQHARVVNLLKIAPNP